MAQRSGILALTMLLLGCSNQAPAPIGFVNQTRHSDTALWIIWTAAQRDLATNINLNPLQPSESAPPDIVSGDPRALSILPRHLIVGPEPDISSSALAAATGIRRASPTGMIACPQPCNVRYTTAYSRYNPAVVRYAASWELSEDNFRDILEYEFENQILFALGYDMRWR
jgi:hypothetical protein